MRLMPFVLGLAILAGSTSAFAAAHSDFTKSFPLQTLKTFEFKNQQRISRDPLANNDIWANDVRAAVRNDFRAHGVMEATNQAPDFYVAFYVGLKDRYDINSIGYGLPVFHRGFGQAGGGGRGVMTCGRWVHGVHGHRRRHRRAHQSAGVARL
jgi:hypothetical protein